MTRPNLIYPINLSAFYDCVFLYLAYVLYCHCYYPAVNNDSGKKKNIKRFPRKLVPWKNFLLLWLFTLVPVVNYMEAKVRIFTADVQQVLNIIYENLLLAETRLTLFYCSQQTRLFIKKSGL